MEINSNLGLVSNSLSNGATLYTIVPSLVDNYSSRIAYALARYSRSALGIEEILKEVEIKNIDDNKNIYFIGSKPFKDISSYMRSADAFLLPNSNKSIISERFTSPLKLFSYMAIKKPIVVSDLPSMREILDENMVYFFEPGSEKDLVDKIEQVFKDKALSDKRIQNAYKKVQDFSWINRANRLLKFIGYTEANIK